MLVCVHELAEPGSSRKGRRLRKRNLRQEARLEGLAFHVFHDVAAQVDDGTNVDAFLQHIDAMPLPAHP